MSMSGHFHAYTPPYPWGKRLHCPLNRRLRGPQSRSGHFGEKIHLLLLSWIEPQSLGRPASRCTNCAVCRNIIVYYMTENMPSYKPPHNIMFRIHVITARLAAFCCSSRTTHACCFRRCSSCMQQSHSFTALAETWFETRSLFRILNPIPEIVVKTGIYKVKHLCLSVTPQKMTTVLSLQLWYLFYCKSDNCSLLYCFYMPVGFLKFGARSIKSTIFVICADSECYELFRNCVPALCKRSPFVPKLLLALQPL
jgi:hypothetical protein